MTFEEKVIVPWEENLSEDYVILLMPSKDINQEGSGPKLRRFLEIALESRAIKTGDCRKGNEYYQGGIQAVLDHVEDRAVVVWGLWDRVEPCCREMGLGKHTVNYSLGRWGRMEKLPPREVLQIHTMCGHGMVTANLFEEVVEEMKGDKLTPEQGAEKLFRPCMCGIFNPDRAAKLLRAMAKPS